MSDDRAPPKRVVIGTRPLAGALAFDKASLLSERVLTGAIDGTDHVAVADSTRSTGYVYANPDSIGVEPADGAAAGLPGILSGFACCGPTVLIVLGLQASATVLTLFQWLLPLTVLALVGTLLWVGRKVEG
ncbi:hypothetical protein ACFQER_13795 [Halomicroarcula sp. GCM10025894]|uniref:hypothetical protein n=1 Tax=Halomicroarcula sp. GCM10025894 TaxID=3252673 RepID=UPI0023E8961B|nr:hypothetical protein [Halomicroarcula sp. SHR3]